MNPALLEVIAADIYGVYIDLKYATSDNFTGRPVYAKSICALNKDAAVKLKTAVNLAQRLGYRIKIFDAYRPTEAQQKLWNHTPDANFLADPSKGSPHSRGAALDLTLCDHDGREIDMGTVFDAFTPLSHHGNMEISSEAQKNRYILLGIMSAAGWDFYANEWWHYQLFHARESYPLISDGESGLCMMAIT